MRRVCVRSVCSSRTGVDPAWLIAASRGLPVLVGHDVPGQVAKAWKSTDLHPLPAGLR